MTDMATAYRVAAHAVRQRFADQHPDRLEALDAIGKRDIAVYRGDYDHVENVLQMLGLGFTVDPKPTKLRSPIVIANCSSSAPPGLVSAIEPHVRDGAWFLSTDWSMRNIVQQAFPNTIRHNGKQTSLEIVSVEPAMDSYWAEVVVLGVEARWCMEGSHPIDILDDERVKLDAASHDMLSRFGAGPVAARFDWEAGHVFHVISHFWLMRTDAIHDAHAQPAAEFLRRGMRLSDDAIDRVFREAKVKPDALNFATMQSAATSTELIAQLCVRAMRANAAVRSSSV